MELAVPSFVFTAHGSCLPRTTDCFGPVDSWIRANPVAAHQPPGYLAVVDVGPALLEPMLGNLRASKEHSEIPVLVEQSRIAAAPLTGVLPKYRAMPCSHDELIKLARRRLTSIAAHGRAKAIL